jgi:hypothetical protein
MRRPAAGLGVSSVDGTPGSIAREISSGYMTGCSNENMVPYSQKLKTPFLCTSRKENA